MEPTTHTAGLAGEWSLVAVNDAITEAVGDRTMVVCGDHRLTFAEVRERSQGLARYLRERGIGCHIERGDLEPWEIGQDTVGLVLHNGTEYLEAMFGSFRARAAPFNVNQHYRIAEVTALLADLAPRAVVYHLSYASLVEAACEGRDVVLLHIDDGSGRAPVPGSTSYEWAVRDGMASIAELPAPSPDDLYLVCTGGTTGRPKAVMWRQADAFVGAMAGVEGATEASIAETARNWNAGPWYAVPPLMHAAAQWTAFAGLHLGATVLLHDDSIPFDADRVLGLAERERAFMMSIVGDAYALPMVDALDARPYDLSSMAIVGTGGAATSAHLKDALARHVPNAIIRDGYGASETGGMAFGAHTPGTQRTSFAPGTGAGVVSEDRSRFLQAGDDELGWLARRGRVPLGYLHDPERTVTTFPLVQGERVSIPGDRGHLLDDGSIVLLGRDSMVINTGGEKVFVEEVEEVLRAHPAVRDALVVGRSSERYGSEVVAVVALEPDRVVEAAELRAFVGEVIARFKAPRAVAFCDQVQRLANGKGDYVWATSLAPSAVDAARGG